MRRHRIACHTWPALRRVDPRSPRVSRLQGMRRRRPPTTALNGRSSLGSRKGAPEPLSTRTAYRPYRLADEPTIAVFLIIGDLPDGCRKLPRLQQPHARHGLGEAADHDPLVLPLAREADRKGHAERVAAAPSGASGSQRLALCNPLADGSRPPPSIGARQFWLVDGVDGGAVTFRADGEVRPLAGHLAVRVRTPTLRLRHATTLSLDHQGLESGVLASRRVASSWPSKAVRCRTAKASRWSEFVGFHPETGLR